MLGDYKTSKILFTGTFVVVVINSHFTTLYIAYKNFT